MIKKLLLSAVALIGALTSSAAAGDPVDWYFSHSLNEWANIDANVQFVETETENLFVLKDFDVTTAGFAFKITNAAWSEYYGWSESVDATDKAFTLGAQAEGNGWAQLPIGTYDIYFDYSADTKTIKFVATGETGGETTTDYWYLMLATDSNDWSNSFTQSADDKNIWTLEGFTVTDNMLDEYKGWKFNIVKNSWTETYYGATSLTNANYAYELTAQTSETAGYNVYTSINEGTYTVVWNSETHTLNFTADEADLNWYLIGEFNDWKLTDDYKFVKDENEGTFTLRSFIVAAAMTTAAVTVDSSKLNSVSVVTTAFAHRYSSTEEVNTPETAYTFQAHTDGVTAGNLSLPAGRYHLNWDANNHSLAVSKRMSTGVEDIAVDAADANAPAEYYDLNGRRVSAAAPGLYIKKQGTTVTKVIVK